MLVFFMLGGALRSAGDARTPMVLGVAMTALNIVLEHRADPRPGPDPRVRHRRRGDGTVARLGPRRGLRALQAEARRVGRVGSRARHGYGPDWAIIRALFRFGLPTGIPGDRDEHRRRVDALVHRLAGPERRGAGGVRGLVLAALLARHLDVDRADGRGGGGGGAEPRRRAAGPAAAAVHVAARIGVAGAAFLGLLLLLRARDSCSPSSGCRTRRWSRSARSCCAC